MKIRTTLCNGCNYCQVFVSAYFYRQLRQEVLAIKLKIHKEKKIIIIRCYCSKLFYLKIKIHLLDLPLVGVAQCNSFQCFHTISKENSLLELILSEHIDAIRHVLNIVLLQLDRLHHMPTYRQLLNHWMNNTENWLGTVRTRDL